jgi:2-methylcitrate dehydratase PrpD
MKKDSLSDSRIISEVSSYIANSGEAELPAEVIKHAKHHILDTLTAIVSGSILKPGQAAIKYADSRGGVKEAQVVGSQIVTSAIDAAFANGIMAHADETDDSHRKSRTHPGCAIVPAALSASEREGANGMRFLKGVVVGYDIGCRMTQAIGPENLRNRNYSTHSVGNNFGAAAAAGAVLRLDSNLLRFVLSYAGHQTSGLRYWERDEDHIEKAFVFSGMPARNGVMAALLMQSGFTGVSDPFSGGRNFFETFSPGPKPELLTEELGSRYEITFADIKKFSVGTPIQAPLDALLLLMERHGLTVSNVQSITARLPEDGARTVNNRNMPDINLQYILAVALLDGGLTFEAAHSYKRMNEPAVLDVKKRITLVEDPELSNAKLKRQGIVEITTKDGSKLREHVASVRGTAANPMGTEEVEKKCSELLRPVLGEDRTKKLIDRIWNLEEVKDVRELRPFLTAS